MPYEVTYKDSSRRGVPGSVRADMDGDVAVAISRETFKFVVTMQQTGVHGAILVDRLE